MKHAQTLLAVTFVATSVFASAALAQSTSPPTNTNKADPKQAMPARSDLKPGAAPTVQSMGENAQRQHDPNRAAANKPGTETAPAPGVGDVRDWAKIDTNKDNLVSADEMEKYLADSRTAKPAPAATATPPAKK